jgi:hypothetical protein
MRILTVVGTPGWASTATAGGETVKLNEPSGLPVIAAAGLLGVLEAAEARGETTLVLSITNASNATPLLKFCFWLIAIIVSNPFRKIYLTSHLERLF